MILLATLALSTGSVAAWAHAHRGYQAVVYHWHATLRSSLARDSGTFDEWIDPVSHRSRDAIHSPQGITTWLFRDGMAYRLDGPGSSPSPLPESPGQVRIDQSLQRSGFAGFDQYWFSQVDGRVVHVALHGRAALRFPIPPATAGQPDLLIWLDARTHTLLQRRWIGIDGVPETLTYTRQDRLAPGTLPADFFTPSRQGASPLDQMLAWLSDHLGRHA